VYCEVAPGGIGADQFEPAVMRLGDPERYRKSQPGATLAAGTRARGIGAETARPFAVVIIGGLITGTIMTLFLLPLLYPYFEKKSRIK